LKENKKKDNKSLGLIQQGLNETIFLKVSSVDESVDSFMTQVMNVVNQLRQYGKDLSDKRVIEKVLRSFPKNLNL
jgi:hypothetical protein